jgi:hypothetical protein
VPSRLVLVQVTAAREAVPLWRLARVLVDLEAQLLCRLATRAAAPAPAARSSSVPVPLQMVKLAVSVSAAAPANLAARWLLLPELHLATAAPVALCSCVLVQVPVLVLRAAPSRFTVAAVP